MDNFFSWIAGLDKFEGMRYFFIVAACLALIPYSNTIYKYFRQIVLRKKLEVVFFEYSINQNIYAGKYDQNKSFFVDIPEDDFFIQGTKLRLYWKVEGALKVDIVPIGKGLKGNSVEVIIHKSISKYTLIAYGFWGEKIAFDLAIPKASLYNLETTKISAYSDHIIRENPFIKTLPITEFVASTYRYTNKELDNIRNWVRTNLLKINLTNIRTENLIKPNETKKKLYHKIDEAKIMKGYTFSTKKYQSINLYQSPNNNNITN
jgi:hypothetical protein